MDTTRHSDPTGTRPDAADGAAAGAVPDAADSAGGGCVCGRVEQDLADRLPVLDEVPQLGSLLSGLVRADRLVVAALDTLMGLQDSGLAEQATGIGVDQWLASVARSTGSDVRMLVTATKVLRRLPALRSWAGQGRISWGQLRAIALLVAPVPAVLDDRLDEAIGRAVLFGTPDEDPDHLVRVVRWAINRHHPKTQQSEQAAADANQFVSMQPRLDGSGGKLYGELGPQAWAITDQALNHGILPDHNGPDQDDDGGGVGRWYGAGHKRAARLTAILDHHLATHGHHPTNSSPDGPDGPDRDTAEHDTPDRDTADHDADSDSADRDRGGDGDFTTPSGPEGATGGGGGGSGRAGSRPQLLVRVWLSTLLDRDQTPGELLTTLTGGKVWADAATIRRLVAERGADLRTVIFDDCGTIVGVGRRRRVPPDWLADAILAVHDTCSAPGCQVAARVCDLDHAIPWHPHRPNDAAGATDVGQLAPLCGSHNHRKESDGWRVTQQADGTRRWTHQRSGLATTTRPATWRPPPGDRPTPPTAPDRNAPASRDRPASRDGPAVRDGPPGRVAGDAGGGDDRSPPDGLPF